MTGERERKLHKYLDNLRYLGNFTSIFKSHDIMVHNYAGSEENPV